MAPYSLGVVVALASGGAAHPTLAAIVAPAAGALVDANGLLRYGARTLAAVLAMDGDQMAA